MDKAVGDFPSAHCLLVSANRVVIPYPVYPLGVACLVTALAEHGHRVRHFDLLADGGVSELRRLLQSQRFDLVGMSLRNLDSTDSADEKGYIEGFVETVAVIRAESSAPLVLGGAAFAIMPETLLDVLQADYGIVGEGEELLPWLVGELAAGRKPDKKLYYAQPDGVIARPATLSDSTAGYYLKHGGMLSVQTKRGCPYCCSYCSYPAIEGRRLRFREPQEVAEEVNRLRDRYGAKYLFFTDSFFNDSQGRYLEVAEALIRSGNTLPWCGFFRPRNLNKEHLELLRRAGLAAMEIGTDAACDETLAGIGKDFTFDEVLEVHGQIVGAGIPCAHFVMFGGPGETRQTLTQGLANLDRLTRSVVFAFVGIRILPQTAIYERAIAEGVIDSHRSLLEPVYYYSPEITREEIDAALRESFDGRLDRIYPCHEFETRITMLHQLGHAGPLWDFILKKGRNR